MGANWEFENVIKTIPVETVKDDLIDKNGQHTKKKLCCPLSGLL